MIGVVIWCGVVCYISYIMVFIGREGWRESESGNSSRQW